MKFSENETMILLNDYKEKNLKKGDRGVIIMVYTIPNEAYEVEFVDHNGNTTAQLTLLPHEITKVNDKNIIS